MNWQHHPWTGVFPATLCPFHEDESIDSEGLAIYMRGLAAVDGIKGVVCNGHTGEIMSLRDSERAEVTRITAEAVGNKVKVISGVSGEGLEVLLDQIIAELYDPEKEKDLVEQADGAAESYDPRGPKA